MREKSQNLVGLTRGKFTSSIAQEKNCQGNEIALMNELGWGAWLARSVELVTLDVKVVSSSHTLDVEPS